MLDTTQQQEAPKEGFAIIMQLAEELCGSDGLAALVTMMRVSTIYPLDAEKGKHLGGFAFMYSPYLTAYSNKSDAVRIYANEDGTRTMIWYRISPTTKSLKQVDIAEGITPDKMEPVWVEHTQCAVRLPFFMESLKWKFDVGNIVCTDAAEEVFTPKEIQDCLTRHRKGDWGDLDENDKATNDAGLNKKAPRRLMSVYKLDRERVMWIITEWHRRVTTILLPDEY